MSSVFSADSGDASVIASQLASWSAGESAIASRRTNKNEIVPRKMPTANLGVELGGTKIETIALDCPSSNGLRQSELFRDGGSGSFGLEIRLLSTDVAIVAV